jgi:multicomponent Na+:H+ antiporter subunit E
MKSARNKPPKGDAKPARQVSIGGRVALAGLLFAATWLLWSGMLKPLLLGLGSASVLLVLWLALRIGFFEPSMHALHLFGRLPRFWLWLIPEIVKANLAVTRIVLSPGRAVSPCITTVDASALSHVSQAVLANAITLTPGTLTLDVDAGRIEVHCLTRAFARGLEAPALLAHARRLERR